MQFIFICYGAFYNADTPITSKPTTTITTKHTTTIPTKPTNITTQPTVQMGKKKKKVKLF